MSVINEEEIFTRVHKYKIFRSEGNLFIDVYEVILGKPAYKFMAVPNLLIQEADKKYFGVGDSKILALKDCLKKIKDVSIGDIVPTEGVEGTQTSPQIFSESERGSKLSNPFRKLSKVFSKRKKESPGSGS
jgi:AAA15 family ATPase/GTPase